MSVAASLATASSHTNLDYQFLTEKSNGLVNFETPPIAQQVMT